MYRGDRSHGRLREFFHWNASFYGLLDDHLTDGLRRRRLNGAVDRHLLGFTGLANLGEVWLVDDNWVEGRFLFGVWVAITFQSGAFDIALTYSRLE